jgi:hypothetical protein
MPEGMQKPSKRKFEAEQALHQERWEAKAEKAADKGVLRRIIERGAPDKTADDFMREEAGRDNDHFDKLKHPEYAEYLKQLKVVLDNLKEKRDNPDADVRAVLFGMGAGMRIPYGIGEVIGLDEMHIDAETFSALYGSSASSALMLYYAAGSKALRKGGAMVCENLATPDFISMAKAHAREIVNLRVFKTEMEEGDKRLDEADMETIRNSSPDINIVVTHPAERGKEIKTEFLDAKTIPNMADGVRASMSIDYVTGEIPTINGIEYRDGSFNPMPIEQIIDDYERKHGTPPTDMLVLVNTPFETRDEFQLSRGEKAGVALAKNIGSLTQIEKFLLMREALRKSLEYARDVKERRGVNVGIVWPPDMNLGTLTINSKDMKAAAFESAREMINISGEKQPDEIAWHVSDRDDLKQAIEQYKQTKAA